MSAEPPKIFVNTRVLLHPVTGTQRYLVELLAHLAPRLTLVQPSVMQKGIPGHLWEQSILPWRTHTGLLWSPTNTGPLAVRRQVLTVHDVAPLDHPEWFEWRYVSWYRRLLPSLMVRVSRIIVPSAFTRARILAQTGGQIAEDRIHVVPHGVSSRFRPCDEADHRQIREHLSLGDGPYILSIGSLEPRKNLSALLAAWHEASRRLPDNTTLVIAGEIGLSRVFRQAGLPGYSPRVRLLGRVPDDLLPALYSGALALVFISHYEGFGMPLLEAMACGTPSLISEAEVFREIARGSALSVDGTRVAEIARALVRMVEDEALRADLRRQSLERAQAFSWKCAAEQTWEVLRTAQEEN